MKGMKYIIRTAALGCYLLILGTILLLFPALFGKRPMIVLSGSMRPTFAEGSLVYMEKAGFSDVQVGDIVTYGEDQIVSHRVVAKMDRIQRLITRGDANESVDPEISADQVLGRIWDGVYIPYAGYVIQGLRRPESILVLAVIIVLDMLMQYWKESEYTENERNGEEKIEEM